MRQEYASISESRTLTSQPSGFMNAFYCVQITTLKELGRLKEHALMQQVFDWAKSTPEECELRPEIATYTTVLAAYTR
jgi:hypothetical protein